MNRAFLPACAFYRALRNIKAQESTDQAALAEHATGSIVCPNCGARSDEPCTDWCAASDPRIHNRAAKRYQLARTLTEGQKTSCAADRPSSSAGVASPSANALDEDVEF